MSLEHAILGFLTHRPLSGYDLKKVFDQTVRHFWPATQSQIYRTLNKMAEQGLVEMERQTQNLRPERKIYHLTARGHEELHRWLTTPLSPQSVREASLIQVFFAGQLSDQEILTGFEHGANQLRALLAFYQRLPQNVEAYVDQAGSEREAFFWLLTLEHGIAMAQAELSWLESIIKRLKNDEHPRKNDDGKSSLRRKNENRSS